jgi:hypothetical protein
MWKGLLCKQTEAEAIGKEVLVEIVILAFQYLTPEASKLTQRGILWKWPLYQIFSGETLALEYAIFQNEMDKLRGDVNQMERMEWNVPGHRGKIFLCFLHEYTLIDEVYLLFH